MSEPPPTFAVLIIDMRYNPEFDRTLDGFPTLEMAREFARRWVRDSLEELRSPAQSAEELRKAWFIFGEDATVLLDGYKGSDEIAFFIAHPASAEERDWASLDRARKPSSLLSRERRVRR